MKLRTIATGTVASLVLLMLLICAAPAFAQIVAPHNADAMWVEPSVNTFDISNTSVGFKFNVTVAMNFTESVFAWQAVIYFNATQLNCTRVGATATSTSDFMSGHSTTFSKGINTTAYPPVNGSLYSVIAAETCSSPDFVTGPHSGTLYWAEFEILLAPDASQNLTSTFDISTRYALTDTYVWDQNGLTLTFTPRDATYSFVPELGPMMIAIFVTTTLAAVILSKNRVSKETRIDSN